MSRNIPCTVVVLTRNSKRRLRARLRARQEFDELLICDGGSTDRTLAIAESFGARVIGQDKIFLPRTGAYKISPACAIRRLPPLRMPGFFFLDSVEYVSPALARSCARRSRDKPAAYWVPRKYVYRGKVVDRAVTYPNRRMRF